MEGERDGAYSEVGKGEVSLEEQDDRYNVGLV